MEKFYQKEHGLEKEKGSDVYVPGWAQVLIDLYTSPLKYEVMYEMRSEPLD